MRSAAYSLGGRNVGQVQLQSSTMMARGLQRGNGAIRSQMGLGTSGQVGIQGRGQVQRPFANMVQASRQQGMIARGRLVTQAAVTATTPATTTTAGSVTDVAPAGQTTPATASTPAAGVQSFDPATTAQNSPPTNQAAGLPTSFLGGPQGLTGGAPGLAGGNVQGPGFGLGGGGAAHGGFQNFGPQGNMGQLPVQSMGGVKAGHQNGSTTTSETDSEAQKAFEKLRTDLQAIEDKSQVTPALMAAVRKDFEKIRAAATSEVDQDKLKSLSDDIKAYDGQLPTDEQKAQVKAAFGEVLKSQGITDQALIDQTIADIEAVDSARNITADDLATLAADRKAIEAIVGTPDAAKTDGATTASPGQPGQGLAFPGVPFGAFPGR